MSNLSQQSNEVYARLQNATRLPRDISQLSVEYAIGRDLDLTRQQIADIVAARSAEGTLGLRVARENGHALAVEAYIAGLTTLRHENRITHQQFEDLVGVTSLELDLAQCAIS